MKKCFLKNLLTLYAWLILGIISLGLILIIRIIKWYPISWNYWSADDSNIVIESLCYSILAAVIFYVLNDWAPQRKIRKVSRKHIERNLIDIQEIFNALVLKVAFFRIDIQDIYDKQKFTHLFSQKNLFDMSDGVTIETYINNKKNEIIAICENLMCDYIRYMTIEELTYVDKILSSYFITEPLRPMNFAVPIEYRDVYPHNQKEIGESIIDLYHLKFTP